MKLPCKVIEDMLPLYHDGVCSAETAALVERHLKTCPQCSRTRSALEGEIALAETPVDDLKPLKGLRKKYKIALIVWVSVIAVILALIPGAFLAGGGHFLATNYSEKEAVAAANAFMDCLVAGNYAEAFSYWDIASKKHEWLSGNDFREEDLVNLESDGLKKFCQLGQSKVEALGGIASYTFSHTFDSGYDYRGCRQYTVHYTVQFAGKEEEFSVRVTEHGVSSIIAADGYLRHPLMEFCIWGHWLYDDYLGRYYDYDRKEYVYYGSK